MEIRKQPSASTNPATHQPGNVLTRGTDTAAELKHLEKFKPLLVKLTNPWFLVNNKGRSPLYTVYTILLFFAKKGFLLDSSPQDA